MTSEGQQFYEMGVAWYTRDQWSLLKAFAADGEALDATYEAWHAGATKLIEDLEKRPDIQARRVFVDIQEMIAWCREAQLPFNSAARAEYVAEKVRSSSL